jgi:hypothetical protein
MNLGTHQVEDSTVLTPRWMTIKQGAAYGPYGEKRLVELIRERKIRGCQLADNKKHPWVVDRLSLDEYVQRQIDSGGIDEKKIIAFLEGRK